MKNIWKTLVSVCASAVLLFSVLLSVGVIAKNKDLSYSTNNNSNTSAQTGSVSGGGIEIDKSSPYEKVYYASATTDTGAAEAEAGEKGGAICLNDVETDGKETNMTMNGVCIEGFNSVYGGAVYVGKGCTFILTNGTIQNNTAIYGGAVYVADGGTFIMNGGIVKDNVSTSGGAIFVEEGGTIQLNDGVIIEGNDLTISGYIISEDTIDGFHYMEYGTYPQSYVGDTMNSTLESWYTNNNPTKAKTYTTDTQEWNAYTYTDGNMYARGTSNPNDTTYTYRDGTTIKAKDTVVWFKVEPIVWFVTNYENVLSGADNTVKILSYVALTCDVMFNADYEAEDANIWENSDINTWLNTNFLTTAFSASEQSRINMSTIKNNKAGGSWVDGYARFIAEADGTGEDSSQKIYFLSQDETEALMPTYLHMVCSLTDYAMSNNAHTYIYADYGLSYRPNGGTVHWWLRSAGEGSSGVCLVADGGFFVSRDVTGTGTDFAVRPALQLAL